MNKIYLLIGNDLDGIFSFIKNFSLSDSYKVVVNDDDYDSVKVIDYINKGYDVIVFSHLNTIDKRNDFKRSLESLSDIKYESFYFPYYNDETCIAPTYDEKIDKCNVVSNWPPLIKGIVNDSYQGYALYFKYKDIIVEEFSGFKNINSFEMINSKTNFRLASVSKEFIAYGILTLIDKNMLKLDDCLYDLFDNMPTYTKNIKVSNMLCHTSGLFDYEDMEHTDKQVSDNDVLNYIRSTNNTYFTPGEKYQYSNTAYVLLGLIIEKVSGVKLGKYMLENVFKKANMIDTCVDYEGITKINNRAYGHILCDGKLVMKDQYWCSATIGDGGIYSNINDLKKWIKYLRSIDNYPYNLMFKTNYDNNGNDIMYGYGLRCKKVLNKYDIIYHCGDTIGTNTILGYINDLDIEFVFLTNKGGINTELFKTNLENYLKEVL